MVAGINKVLHSAVDAWQLTVTPVPVVWLLSVLL